MFPNPVNYQRLAYEYEFVMIWHDPVQKLLHIQWHEMITNEDYQLVMRQVLLLTKELDVEGWLFDVREAQLINESDGTENLDGFALFLTQCRLRKFARLDKNEEGHWPDLKEGISQAVAKYNLLLEVEYFISYEEALAWLKC